MWPQMRYISGTRVKSGVRPDETARWKLWWGKDQLEENESEFFLKNRSSLFLQKPALSGARNGASMRR